MRISNKNLRSYDETTKNSPEIIKTHGISMITVVVCLHSQYFCAVCLCACSVQVQYEILEFSFISVYNKKHIRNRREQEREKERGREREKNFSFLFCLFILDFIKPNFSLKKPMIWNFSLLFFTGESFL